jgi:hypothetical protein
MTRTNEDNKFPEQADAASTLAYEAPAIEETITPEELQREVHYAGDGSTILG